MPETIILFDKPMSYHERLTCDLYLYFKRLSFLMLMVLLIAFLTQWHPLTWPQIWPTLAIIAYCYLIFIIGHIWRARTYVSHVSLTDGCFTFKYQIRKREYLAENIPVGEIKMKLESGWFDRRPMWKLAIYIRDKKLLRQEQIDEWTVDKFKELIAIIPKPHYVQFH